MLRCSHWVQQGVQRSTARPPFTTFSRLYQANTHDTLPDGTSVRRNERVMLAIYAMGRLPSLWPNPEQFNPSRFIDEAGKFQPPSPSVFPVFLAGPRMCLGKEMAFLGSGILIVSLLDRHRIKLQLPSSLSLIHI